MISHYTAIVFVSALVMLIMIFGVESNIFIAKERKRFFQLTFLLLIIANILEWASAFTNEKDVSLRWITIFGKFGELMITPVIPIVAALCLERNKYTKYMLIPIGMNSILQIVSLFTGSVFYVTKDNVYNHGPWYFVYVILFVITVIFILFQSFSFSRRYQYRNILFLILIFAVVVIASLMQLLLPHLRLDWTCISFASCMFYIYYFQLTQQTDSLTNLLNRKSFDCWRDNNKKECSMILMDIDHFKNINDTYGHEKGDQILKEVGLLIRTSFEKYGTCYRIGGDEFLIVVKNNKTDIEKIIKKFNKEVMRHYIGSELVCSLSSGYSHYDGTQSMLKSFDEADKMMYERKNTR